MKSGNSGTRREMMRHVHETWGVPFSTLATLCGLRSETVERMAVKQGWQMGSDAGGISTMRDKVVNVCREQLETVGTLEDLCPEKRSRVIANLAKTIDVMSAMNMRLATQKRNMNGEQPSPKLQSNDSTISDEAEHTAQLDRQLATLIQGMEETP